VVDGDRKYKEPNIKQSNDQPVVSDYFFLVETKTKSNIYATFWYLLLSRHWILDFEDAF